ncbi:MAG: hypothetical protein J7K46_03515 [Bacteroidales bacterium]|nr:hypothetical protein [Bacteroidales bacterium]
MTEEVFRKSFEIHSYDTDTTTQLSFAGLARYLQDIASFHADKLGLGYDDLLAENKAWVLRQLKIATSGRAFWKDKVTIETWPKVPDRLLAWRDFLVFDEVGNPIAKATSAWLLIDVKKRRPLRMEPGMFEKYNFRKQNVFDEKPGSLPSAEPGEKIYETTVRFSKLDLNDHVNNAEFIAWVTDAYYMDYPHDSYPENFEIRYDHEIFMGDRIGIFKKILPSGGIIYSINRMEDEKIAGIARVSGSVKG